MVGDGISLPAPSPFAAWLPSVLVPNVAMLPRSARRCWAAGRGCQHYDSGAAENSSAHAPTTDSPCSPPQNSKRTSLESALPRRVPSPSNSLDRRLPTCLRSPRNDRSFPPLAREVALERSLELNRLGVDAQVPCRAIGVDRNSARPARRSPDHAINGLGQASFTHRRRT